MPSTPVDRPACTVGSLRCRPCAMSSQDSSPASVRSWSSRNSRGAASPRACSSISRMSSSDNRVLGVCSSTCLACTMALSRLTSASSSRASASWICGVWNASVTFNPFSCFLVEHHMLFPNSYLILSVPHQAVEQSWPNLSRSLRTLLVPVQRAGWISLLQPVQFRPLVHADQHGIGSNQVRDTGFVDELPHLVEVYDDSGVEEVRAA